MKPFSIDLVLSDITNNIVMTHTYNGFTGTFNQYTDIIDDAHKKYHNFVMLVDMSDEWGREQAHQLLRFQIKLRNAFASSIPHKRKTFKKELMARGHSPREAEAMCKTIASYGGLVRYDWIGYTLAWREVKGVYYE